MKKFLLVPFFLLAAIVPASAQSWAAPGATWYYDYVYFSQTGYERIQNIGDTVINGKQYNKLQTYRTWYDQSNQTTGSYYVPFLEFTREDSGVVYIYRDNADYVLYDFNAQPGDTWVLHADQWISGSPCDTGSIVVDSISTVIINGDTLRTLRTSPVSWSGITFYYPPLVEKIGSLGNLFPMAMCVTDIPQGYNLRCYSDSTGWTYQNPNLNSSCDDIMNVDEPGAEQFSFVVVPDYSSGHITLTGSAIKDGALIEIYDAMGQVISREVVQMNGSAVVNLDGSAGGIYFVSVQVENSRAMRSFYLNGN